MYLRYNTIAVPPKQPREVKVNLDKEKIIAWRYGYNSNNQITHFYLVYIDQYNQRNSLYIPTERLLDKNALFEYMEKNHRAKCLEK